MAWHQKGAKPLPESIMTQSTAIHIYIYIYICITVCITGLQWVNEQSVMCTCGGAIIKLCLMLASRMFYINSMKYSLMVWDFSGNTCMIKLARISKIPAKYFVRHNTCAGRTNEFCKLFLTWISVGRNSVHYEHKIKFSEVESVAWKCSNFI